MPLILVGCKKDLRVDAKTIDELQKISQKPVSYEEGLAAGANIGASKYYECSAKLNDGVQEVFEEAARSAYIYRDKLILKHNKGRSKCLCL